MSRGRPIKVALIVTATAIAVIVVTALVAIGVAFVWELLTLPRK